MVTEEELKSAIVSIMQLLGDPDPDIELEESPSHRWSGFVSSGVFSEMGQIERQEQLWDGLVRSLGKDKTRDIAALLTMSPEEIEE